MCHTKSNLDNNTSMNGHSKPIFYSFIVFYEFIKIFFVRNMFNLQFAQNNKLISAKKKLNY